MYFSRKHIALFYGLIAGIFMILFSTVLYKAGLKYYLGEIAYLGYAAMIGLAAIAALTEKRANDGYLEFRAALKTCFTVFVIGLAIHALFTWFLMNFLDIHFKYAVTQAVMDREVEMLRKMGITEDQISRTIAEQKGRDDSSLGRVTMGLAYSYIVHFLIALLIAAIVKKKKPVFSDAGI